MTHTDIGNALQKEGAATALRFDLFSNEDRAAVLEIGMRIARLVMELKKRLQRDELLDPDAMLIQMDIATVHYVRGLDLFAMRLANDLDLMECYVVIAKNINRGCGAFPDGVRLKFDRR